MVFNYLSMEILAVSTFRVFHRFITLTMEAVSSSENSATITDQHGVTSQILQPSSATLWKLQILYFLFCCSAHIHVSCKVRTIAVIFLFCYSTSIAQNATGLKHFIASKMSSATYCCAGMCSNYLFNSCSPPQLFPSPTNTATTNDPAPPTDCYSLSLDTKRFSPTHVLLSSWKPFTIRPILMQIFPSTSGSYQLQRILPQEFYKPVHILSLPCEPLSHPIIS